MEVARITSGGQVTVPIGIRDKLGLSGGGKIVFWEDAGRIVVANAAKSVFDDMRTAFAGEAERLGLKDEQDVAALVDEVREEMWNECYAYNA
ncbi:MAG: AbrB/MazE/SpoVT family DNA-binding domain-containing protein [Oscillospiraceae bacterium]|jgi:AbrB family looped-hinge helix DNA binding protein|nr:AbrB/MazE/SpoVT family DNA-binding domain-containing protein [Oscillospiraceae bacterium]